MKLDLGCGPWPAAGYQGVDIMEIPGVIKYDLNTVPWPWDAGSIEAIRLSHSLEHFRELDDIFNELHRVLSDDGEIEIIIPYCLSEAGLYPGHAVFLGTEFFKHNALFNKLFVVKFQEFGWNEPLASNIEALGIPRTLSVMTMWNIAKTMTMYLRKRTPEDGIWADPV